MRHIPSMIRVLVIAGLTALGAGEARASIFTVYSNADSGSGTLRAAIAAANTTAAADKIVFALPGSTTIALLSCLPPIYEPLEIDGTTQPGFAGTPIVELDGTNAGTCSGLTVIDGPATIRGLVINRFALHGIRLAGGGFHLVEGCYIGTDPAGTAALGNGAAGIAFEGAGSTVIGGVTAPERNVISANASNGITVGVGTANAIIGNYLGTTASGAAALGNGGYGIRILPPAAGTYVGVALAGAGNVISGNWRGLAIESDGSFALGNVVGLNAAGTAKMPNQGGGIEVSGADVLIGGTSAVARNVVSGNDGTGVTINADAVGCTVAGNYIGTNAAGTAALGNDGTGVRIFAAGGVLGGGAPGAGNVISGNAERGVYMDPGADGWTIAGNYIGTNAGGTAALGNAGAGLQLFGVGGALGGSAPGAGNVISGNGGAGVYMAPDAEGWTIAGNRIGTSGGGTAALGNAGSGLQLVAASGTVGGSAPGAGNVISGNGGAGIYMSPDAHGWTIAGNRVGTDAAGTTALGNQDAGIRVFSAGNTIGGAAPGAGNVLSGNRWGVTIEASGTDNAILGNLIGLDASGASALGNDHGVYVRGPGNTIGAPGAGNVISANDGAGVILRHAGATGNVVQANLIGTAPNGTGDRGNGQIGVWVREAFDNLIGGTAAGAGNVIAHGGLYGVFVDAGTGNAILGNSIFANDYWGIDLAPYGVTPNDPGDADFGPNRTQNHPVLAAVTVGNGATEVSGALASTPDAVFRVELFSSPDCDPSGFGEARTFLGAVDIATDAGGKGAIAATLPFEVTDEFVTATATSAGDDTSELSACTRVGGPHAGVLQFSQEQFVGYENEPDGTVAITVTRAEGSAGTVTVHYETADAGATAGDDYTATAGVLSFGPGETVKTFDVPVDLDLDAEGQENITLTLSAPAGGATLGLWATSKIALIDYDPVWPTAYVSDASVVEGDGGATSMAFTLTLSPGSQPVTVKYATIDGTAVAGLDYEATSGEAVFQPGDGPKTVHVPVMGDGDDEGTEVFFLTITQVLTGTLTDGIGEGLIVDDDAAGGGPVCGDGTVEAGEQCDDGNLAGGDGCEADCTTSPLCAGGAPFAKARIAVKKLGGQTGDEQLTFGGRLLFPAGAPAGYDPLDAIARGAQLLVEDLGGGGTALIDLTGASAVAPGAYGPACDPAKHDGWKANRKLTAYTYRGRSNMLAGACTPGSAQGLAKLVLKDKRAKGGGVHFAVTVKGATIAAPVVGPLRGTLILDADPAAGPAGACGVHAFPAGACKANKKGTALTCK